MNGLYAYALCFAEYEWLISELRFSWKSILSNFYWTTPYEKEARCISIYICFINDAKREQMSYCVLNNINDIVIVLTVPADWAIVRDRPFSPWTTEILNLICDSAFLSISHSDEWSYDLLFSSHSSGSRNIRYASQFLFRDKNLQLFFSSVDAQKSEEIESESERASKRESGKSVRGMHSAHAPAQSVHSVSVSVWVMCAVRALMAIYRLSIYILLLFWCR